MKLAAAAIALPLLLACATAPVGPSLTPVTLVQVCPVGPYCVTGQIDDQFALAVAGARCFVLNVDGQLSEVTSDARGVFLIDGLAALPHDVRFEKAGFEGQVVPVLSGGAGTAARAYVTLHRYDESEAPPPTR